MVVVEAGIHAAELGQAHRHVAVVEDDRDAEPLAQRGRDATEVRHRNREEDDCIGALALDQSLEVTAPAGGDGPPDRLPGETVERALVGGVLTPPQIPIAFEAREAVPHRRIRLRLAVGGVGSRAPPGRLDRTAAIRRHDEVDAGLVHALPELPPRGRTAVAEVEVDGGRHREKLRSLHGGIVGRHPVGPRASLSRLRDHPRRRGSSSR